MVIISLGILSLYIFWNPDQTALFPKCPFYSFTGIYCPGCGSQRAIHDIIHGDILKGIRHNYLIVLATLVLLYEGYVYLKKHVLKQQINNLLHKSRTTKTILTVVILFWVLRNIHLFPFTELAP